MQLSVIIPTLNEEENIGQLLVHLKSNLSKVDHEIIVADAGSTDRTRENAKQHGIKVLNCEKMSRAYQMNEGAKIAKGEILYFVHADSLPPENFYGSIEEALNEGYKMGCFRFKFDSNHWLLAFNSYCTRFDRIMCRGGDQTLFIKRSTFDRLRGYKDDYRIMEEYEFILRARKELDFKIIPRDVRVSARKYEKNSYLRVNIANLAVFILFRMGASQKKMLYTYRKLLNHPKLEALQ